MEIVEDLNKKKVIISLSKREAENILTDIDVHIQSFHYKITGEFISKLKFSWNVLNQFLINLDVEQESKKYREKNRDKIKLINKFAGDK